MAALGVLPAAAVAEAGAKPFTADNLRELLPVDISTTVNTYIEDASGKRHFTGKHDVTATIRMDDEGSVWCSMNGDDECLGSFDIARE